MLKRNLSQLTLILMLVSEILIPLLWFNVDCRMEICLVFGFGLPWILMCIAICKGFENNIFKLPHADLLKRMISSNVRNVTLAVFILLFFLAQITWLMDSAYSMLFDFSSDRFPQEMTAFLLSGASMIISMIIYPYAPAPDFGLDKRKKIYSAISLSREGLFEYSKAEVLFKPFYESVIPVNSDKPDYLFGIKKLYIVLSNSIDFNKKIIDFKTFEENKPELVEMLKQVGIESIPNDGIIDEEIFKKFLHIVLKYKIATHPGIQDPIRDRLIKQSEHLEIIWRTDQASGDLYKSNYNIFHETFEAIQKCLKDNESGDTSETLLYITPGTAVVTGAFSALSLRGSRLILYVNQGNGQLMAINPNTEAMNEYLDEIKDE